MSSAGISTRKLLSLGLGRTFLRLVPIGAGMASVCSRLRTAMAVSASDSIGTTEDGRTAMPSFVGLSRCIFARTSARPRRMAVSILARL